MEFFKSLFLLLFGQDDSASRNKKALQQVGKELDQNKYRKWYKVKSREIRPEAGIFFYEVYKAVYPIRPFMRYAEKSPILKQIIAETFADPETRKLYNALSPETLAEQAKTADPQDLIRRIEEAMQTVSNAALKEQAKIDRCYQLITEFARFAKFDFFSLLKNFDPSLKEGQGPVQPQGQAVPGRYLTDHLKRFLELPDLAGTQEEWRTVFEIVKKYKLGAGMINAAQWNKALLMMQDVQKSRILVLMIRHIEQDPAWHTKVHISFDAMTDVFLKAKTLEVQAAIGKLKNDSHAAERDALAKKLFGNPNITRLRHYTAAAHEVFIKKDTEGFAHIQVLNYMEAFFIDYQDILELWDLLLIRGQWASQDLSRQVSQVRHEITDIAMDLTAFDESLADNGTNGVRLKTYLNKANTDKSTLTDLNAALRMINSKAKTMVSGSVSAFTLFGSYLKDLSDDYAKQQFACLVNWKALEALSEHPIGQRMEQGAQVIGDFVVLLRLFLAEDGSVDG